MKLFSVEDRGRLQGRILEMAASDERIVAAAVVGSLASGRGDRWSDLDLTFAVAAGVPIRDVLDDWTRQLARDCDAVELFDLQARATLYRVFLLPGCLQVDLSFAAEADFGASGPDFKLLFGSSVEKAHTPPPDAQELFGYAVHHALRARFCIERGRHWQAEYWTSAVRDYALSLACLRRNLPVRYGRGFDDLPAEVRDAFRAAFAHSLEREELLRALGSAVAGLLREAGDAGEKAATLRPSLMSLASAADTVDAELD